MLILNPTLALTLTLTLALTPYSVRGALKFFVFARYGRVQSVGAFGVPRIGILRRPAHVGRIRANHSTSQPNYRPPSNNQQHQPSHYIVILPGAGDGSLRMLSDASADWAFRSFAIVCVCVCVRVYVCV